MNPFRSEAAAYRFLMFVAGVLAAVVVADRVGGNVASLTLTALVAVGVLTWVSTRRVSSLSPPRIDFGRGAANERRIIVVANETVGGTRLFEEIRARALDDNAQILVLCPALNSRLRHWLSDEDGARAAARRRLDASLSRLAGAGIDARGEIGDADPIQAIEDALRTFGGVEIIISTHPPGQSNWLERGVVSRARELFPLPIAHVIGEQFETRAPAAVAYAGGIPDKPEAPNAVPT
ncbi:MAG TPA: hypothetical protein VGO39_14200 [Gaiellaceae bacterium]|jgi:hypothetical protein|nr:hypothetical protein [Gaiellaceae bacterium]